MKPKTTKSTTGAKLKRRKPVQFSALVRQHVSVSQIDSMLFECSGAVLQYCNRYVSIWIDGDTSHEPDIELNVDVLNRIAAIGNEQVHEREAA